MGIVNTEAPSEGPSKEPTPLWARESCQVKFLTVSPPIRAQERTISCTWQLLHYCANYVGLIENFDRKTLHHSWSRRQRGTIRKCSRSVTVCSRFDQCRYLIYFLSHSVLSSSPQIGLAVTYMFRIMRFKVKNLQDVMAVTCMCWKMRSLARLGIELPGAAKTPCTLKRFSYPSKTCPWQSLWVSMIIFYYWFLFQGYMACVKKPL